MLENMFNTVAGKRIALFGFAFKADTSDTRESPALAIARGLLEERAHVVISDPQALENAKADFREGKEGLSFEANPYRAADGAHAIALLTDWQLYRDLDYDRILRAMEQPAFVFDGRNMLDHKKLFALGFNVFAIGKVPLKHF
jgi:UDPglucose 6-dehydrogenase